MRIYGLDFTSVPNHRKPITCVKGELTDQHLRIHDDLICITNFAEFEAFLTQPGPWIAGLDFPFGQPHKLIKNLDWPETWSGYVGKIAAMTPQEFEVTLARYRQSRPAGDKHHRRATDHQANARSPMMLYGVPVGKMFFQGAPRLLKADVSVLPCRPTNDKRIVVEAYPALVARKWIDRRSYKNDTKKKQTADQKTARKQIIEGLQSLRFQEYYGFVVELSKSTALSSTQDPSGDTLDGLLCAVQAAWAYTRRNRNYGIPADCHPAEGWIVDPDLLP